MTLARGFQQGCERFVVGPYGESSSRRDRNATFPMPKRTQGFLFLTPSTSAPLGSVPEMQMRPASRHPLVFAITQRPRRG